MKASQLKKKPKHMYNFTGLSVEQFDSLCKAIKQQDKGQKAKPREARQRAAGGGRKAELSLEDQVLMTLMYYRLYVTQILPGYLFNLDDSNISRWINRLRPSLLEVLPLPVQESLLFAQAERSQRRISNLEELLEKHPEFKEVLVDATEQERQKPKDRQKRKDT